MANIEHKDLPNSELHEPKDISTASDNTVYLSNGLGTGVWDKVTGDEWVIVNDADDLPAAVANVRTLAADTTYIISGVVDIGSDRIVMSNNSMLTAINQDFDKIVSSTTGALITSTDVNSRLVRIGFDCLSGTFIDADGTGVESIDLIRLNVVCDTIGDFDNFANIDIFRSAFDATTAGMTFTGAHQDLEVRGCLVDVAATNGTCIDLGVATFDTVYLDNIEFKNPTGTGFGIDVAASGANLNATKIGIISACTFSNTSNASNYVEGSVGWIIAESVGVAPSAAKAQGHVVTNANANTFGGGVGVPEAVNFGTSFLADIQHKFTISNAGLFTYNGRQTKTFAVEASIYVTMGGGAARVRRFYIAKNGSVITSSIIRVSLDGSTPDALSCYSIVTMAPGDTVRLFIEAETATTSTTVETCSFKIVEAN